MDTAEASKRNRAEPETRMLRYSLDGQGDCVRLQGRGDCGRLGGQGDSGYRNGRGDCGRLDGRGVCRQLDGRGDCGCLDTRGDCGCLDGRGDCGRRDGCGDCGCLGGRGDCVCLGGLGDCGYLDGQQDCGDCADLKCRGGCGYLGDLGGRGDCGYLGDPERRRDCGYLDGQADCRNLGHLGGWGECGFLGGRTERAATGHLRDLYGDQLWGYRHRWAEGPEDRFVDLIKPVVKLTEYQKSYGGARSRSLSPRCFGTAQYGTDYTGLPGREPDLFGLGAGPDVFPEGRSESPTGRVSSIYDIHKHIREVKRGPEKDPEPGPGRRSPYPEAPTAELQAQPRPQAPPPGLDLVMRGRSAKRGDTRSSVKPRFSQSQPSRPMTSAAVPGTNGEDAALRWRVGLRSPNATVRRSEYHRQFYWRPPVAVPAPFLPASKCSISSKAVPSCKKPVPADTEYRRSFPGTAPVPGPRVRKHVDTPGIPMFQSYQQSMKEKKLRPSGDDSAPDVHHIPRSYVTEYESSFMTPDGGRAATEFTMKLKNLRQEASAHRYRSWGSHFSRNHLGQLQSVHTPLWNEPDQEGDAHSDPGADLQQEPRPQQELRPTDHAPAVEALVLHSKRSSCVGSRETNGSTNGSSNGSSNGTNHRTNHRTTNGTNHGSSMGSRPRRQTCCEDEGNSDEEEGRLPTPQLRPVQRPHHDLSSTAGGAAPAADSPVIRKEAWSANGNSHHWSPDSSPKRRPDSEPIRTQQTPPPPLFAAPVVRPGGYRIQGSLRSAEFQHNAGGAMRARKLHSSDSPGVRKEAWSANGNSRQWSPLIAAPVVIPALYGIQGSLRSAEFQHNGDLGLRFRWGPVVGGACDSDEDERLSVLSRRSSASCAAAAAILERAQRRREDFWGET